MTWAYGIKLSSFCTVVEWHRHRCELGFLRPREAAYACLSRHLPFEFARAGSSALRFRVLPHTQPPKKGIVSSSSNSNINRRPKGRIRSGGMRAFVYFMPTYLYHGEFNAGAINRFLSRDDKCSLPPRGGLHEAADDTILLHDAVSLVLFKFTRTPRELWDALGAHEEIRQLLATMSANGQEHRLQSGALLQANPLQRPTAAQTWLSGSQHCQKGYSGSRAPPRLLAMRFRLLTDRSL